MISIRRGRPAHRKPDSTSAGSEPGAVSRFRDWAVGLRINRRRVQVALGLLWLIDGALQLQPYMFSPGFSTDVLQAASSGQPGWVSTVVGVFFHLVAAHPIAWNAGFAATQIALGIGLLVPRLVRSAVVASVLWAIAVWWVGEGFGGLLKGNATLITGAPGAAVLYAILAVAAWPRPDRCEAERKSGSPVSSWLPFAWLVIWLGGAALQLLPGQNRPGDVSAEISNNASGFFAHVGGAAAQAVNYGGAPLFVIVVGLMAAVGLAGLRSGRCRTVSALTGAGLAFIFWMFGQSFGQLDSGRATDLNSGPLLIVMALALLTSSPRGALPDLGTHSAAVPTALHRLPLRSRLGTSAAAFAAAAVLTVLVTVGAAARTATQAPSAMSMSRDMSMPTGMSMPTPSQIAVKPSVSARMICSPEIRRDVAMITGLRKPPIAASTWVDHVYTCTYELPNGSFALSVYDAPDRASAHAYFKTISQRLGHTRPLKGLTALGLPAYETTSGVVVFLKDDKTLEVDASGLRVQIGPNRGTASDLAYAVASDVMGCWTGK